MVAAAADRNTTPTLAAAAKEERTTGSQSHRRRPPARRQHRSGKGAAAPAAAPGTIIIPTAVAANAMPAGIATSSWRGRAAAGQRQRRGKRNTDPSRRRPVGMRASLRSIAAVGQRRRGRNTGRPTLPKRPPPRGGAPIGSMTALAGATTRRTTRRTRTKTAGVQEGRSIIPTATRPGVAMTTAIAAAVTESTGENAIKPWHRTTTPPRRDTI